MSLAKYKQKRSFDKTPEPTGGKPVDNKLHFVVQKHHASHLHYDFRLEMEGVLKSWAVPKGPSMDPGVKRLAMMVEDHPWDYRNFEGIIPQGYGAGTVIVWDNGTYEPSDKKTSKKENEKSLLHHLYQGAISFVLQGKKLKGEFSLVKTTDRGDNAWLLIKKKDQYASQDDISKKDKSVLSNKTLEQVKNTSDNIWESHRSKKKNVTEKITAQQTDTADIAGLIKNAKKAKFLAGIKPMLCSLIKEPFENPEYVYEVKWDGYRIIASIHNGEAALNSRSGLNYTDKYGTVVKALQMLPFNAVLDGEVVALNKDGRPDFDALQKNSGENPLVLYLFDILWYDGYSLMDLPLIERKEILATVIPFGEVLKYSDHFEQGEKLFDLMKKQDMEGIVIKRKGSKYLPGKRSKDWLKLPTDRRQEFVIGGWTESDSGAPFASLLFGYYKSGKFLYQGQAGGGYTQKEKPKILSRLKKLEISNTPFDNKVDTDRKVHWAKPELVANIKFATYTSSGKIRKPAIFLGFRDDKKPEQVVEEKIVEPEKLEDNETENITTIESQSNWKIIEAQEITSKDIFNIKGKNVQLTNVEKQLWPGVIKADLIKYYHAVAPYILPHIKDRPQSLHINYLGPHAPGIFIKDMEGKQPEWAEIFSTKRKHKKKGKRNIIDYLVCQDEATLLYMINLGCIDINPWTSRVTNYHQPDFIIIDLDPSDDDFEKVILTASTAKKIFDVMKIKAFPKTSGKTGMHLYIPCSSFTFPEARKIAENICGQIHEMIPDITSTAVTIAHRGNKLYLDPNQNDEADTVAAPYSVRPTVRPTVSAPLEWKEVNKKLKPQNFDIHNIISRIDKKGDLFKHVMDEKIRKSNTRLLKKLLK